MSQPAKPVIPTRRDGLTCVQDGSVLTVTMDRPEVRNAMRPSTWAALAEVGATIGDDVRVVVLRGAGEAFSSGLDRRLLTGETVGQDAPLTTLFEMSFDDFDRTVETYQQGFLWLRDPRFISIAVVQGHAIGAGFQLALACDIRIAADDARFNMREPALGIVPDLTGTQHLVRAVGYARALEWTTSARFVEADEALASGLVSRVVSRQDLDAAVDDLVQGMTAHPHAAVTATKSLLLGATERSFDEQRGHEREAQFHRFQALAAAQGTTKDRLEVLGRRMAFVDVGSGAPLVFLHGNPTSSYLWRNVIAPLSASYRCIAPDLIGMGDSEKLPDTGPQSYTLAEHQDHVDVFLSAVLPDKPVTLVVHDWGSALGFDWARRNPERVRGIAYMEAIVRPMAMSEWSAAGIFEKMRSDDGEELVLEGNVFVEKILPRSILRSLTDEEMDEYRRPFLNAGEDRRPTLSWPRQMPLDGSPADVVQVIERYGEWLSSSNIPKLFVNAEPGAILTGGMREFCRTWPNQTEVTVDGIHFIQEDSPQEIAQAISAWLAEPQVVDRS